MPSDDEMVQLLRAAMAGPPPELSTGFDTRVMRRVRSRGLPRLGRLVLGCYALAAAAVTTWFVRDLPATWLVAGLPIGAVVAATVGAYSHRLLLRV